MSRQLTNSVLNLPTSFLLIVLERMGERRPVGSTHGDRVVFQDLILMLLLFYWPENKSQRPFSDL